jgi:flavorubredoxin
MRFLATPMLHWPETMMTYDPAEKILFSGDAFGSFGALDGGIFDDEIDLDGLEDETIRYFANIIGKYAVMVQRAIQGLAETEIRMIASLHGPVRRTDPARVVDLYDRLSRWEGQQGVALIYASMYGNTRRMMEAVARGLSLEGLKDVVVRDASRTHVSYLLQDCWKYGAVVLGTPTHDRSPLPPVEHLIALLEHKNLKNRLVGLFGSYGWAGGAVQELQKFVEKRKWELVEPVVTAVFAPGQEELKQCRQLGRTLAAALLRPHR